LWVRYEHKSKVVDKTTETQGQIFSKYGQLEKQTCCCSPRKKSQQSEIKV